MKHDPSFPYDMFRYLIKPMRDGDTSGVLERYIAGPQSIFEETHANALATLDLANIDSAPDWALDYLLWIAGWTPDLSFITSGLDATAKRKLIRLSAELWKGKGTEAGIRETIRLFTGRDAVCWSWFYLRMELDKSGLWHKGIGGIDPWLVGSTYGDRDQYLSIVWISDEDDPPKQLIRDLAELHRPLGEAIAIHYAGFVDDFQAGVGKWVTVLGDARSWDSDSRRMVLAGGSITHANVAGVEDWDTFTVTASVRLSAENQQFQLAVRWNGELGAGMNLYSIAVDNGAKTVTLLKVTGAGDVTLGSAAIVALPVSDPVAIVVHSIRKSATELLIVVFLDGVLRLGVTIGLADEYSPGLFAFYPAGSDTLYVDNVIAYQHPVHVDVVEQGSRTVSAEPAVAAVGAKAVPLTVWTPAGGTLWHPTFFDYLLPAGSLYHGQGESGYRTWGAAGDYDGVAAGWHAVTALGVDLSGVTSERFNIFLVWWQHVRIRFTPGDDDCRVRLLDGATPLTTYAKSTVVGTAVTSTWTRRAINITDYAAEVADLVVEFGFNPLTAVSGSDEGWYLDNLAIVIEEK